MLLNYLKIAWRNLRAQRQYALLNTVGLSIGKAGALLIFLFIRHHLSTDRHLARFDHIFRVDTYLYLADGSIEYNPEAPLPLAQVLRTEYPQVEQAAFLRMSCPDFIRRFFERYSSRREVAKIEPFCV